MGVGGKGILVGCVGGAAAVLVACGGSGSSTAGPSPHPSSIQSGLGPSSRITSGEQSAPGTTRSADEASASTALADPTSDAAVLAAVRNYVAAYQEAAENGDPAPFEAVTTADCPCRPEAGSIFYSLRQDGQHTDAVFSAEDLQIAGRGKWNADVSFHLTNGPYHVLDLRDRIIEDGQRGELNVVVSVRWEGGKWLVFFSRSA